MTLDLAHIEAVFLDECREQLAVLEASLLNLEQAPDDGEVLGRMFRAAHSIKGGAATFGLTIVARLTHGMESLLDAMRAGRIRATAVQVDALLAGADRVRALLAARAAGQPEPSIDEALAACERALDADGAPSGPAERRVRIHFAPGAETLRTGIDPILVLRELTSVGRLAGGSVDADAVPPLDALEPLGCYLRWDLGLDSDAPIAAIRELFDYAEDGSVIAVDDERAPVAIDPTPAVAVAAAAPGPRPPSRPAVADGAATLRVATDKVDRLMNLVGELLINQSMVVEAVRTFRPEKLAALQEACIEMERTTREVQERVMAIRMLPVATVLGRLPRLVRDLSTRLDKPVAIELLGEDTELDKGVLDGLVDPLTHLVRNAIDHGLEPAATRIAAGKPETGLVRISATHEGSSVVLEVSDDGRGLDTARIRARAVERGLVAADAVLDDASVHALIFEPGFSTADAVSDVSGRGVGMDVVLRGIEAMNGTVSIRSRAGAGTSFRIELPLTLAIVDGMCMRVGATTFVVPLTSIVESLRPAAGQVRRVLGRGEVIGVRGQQLPLVRLHQVLSIDGAVTDPRQGLVVLLEDRGRRVGVLVDDVVGQAQVVVKGLETHFRRVDGLVGATILGDGHVALILDAQRLVRGSVVAERAPLSRAAAGASP